MKEIPVLLQIPVLVIMALAVVSFCYGAGKSASSLRSLGGPEREPRQALEPDRRRQKEIDYQLRGGAGDADIYYRGHAGPMEQGPYDRTHESYERDVRKRVVDLRLHTGNKSPEVLRACDLPDTETQEHPEVVSSSKSSILDTNLKKIVGAPGESSPAEGSQPAGVSDHAVSGTVESSPTAEKAQLKTGVESCPQGGAAAVCRKEPGSSSCG